MEIVITGRNGWSKQVRVEKSIIRIGSAVSNDIHVESPQIAPIHLQVFQSSDSACRVLNLANVVTIKSGRSSEDLLAFTAREIRDGDEIGIGEFQLLFKLPVSSGLVRPSRVIEASLTFADAVLHEHIPAVGLLTVKNKGDKDASQFQVRLSGLPSDCYQVDPLPLMYPGAQEEIRIRLFHKITHPQAGPVSLAVVISAPESYPGEEALLQQKIYVEPVFKQVMEIKDDVEAPQPQPEHNAALSGTLNQGLAATSVEQRPIERPAPVAMQAESFSRIEPVTPPPPATTLQVSETTQPPARPAKVNPTATQEFDLSKLKVVHGPSDEFWDT